MLRLIVFTFSCMFLLQIHANPDQAAGRINGEEVPLLSKPNSRCCGDCCTIWMPEEVCATTVYCCCTVPIALGYALGEDLVRQHELKREFELEIARRATTSRTME